MKSIMNIKPNMIMTRPCDNKVDFTRPNCAQIGFVATVGQDDWRFRYKRMC